MSASRSHAPSLGDLFLASLVAEGELTAVQVGRGRGLDARGAVHNVGVEPATLSASVRMRSSEPRRVLIGCSRIGEATWATAIEVTRSVPRWRAAVAEGSLPQELLDALADAEVAVGIDAVTTSVDCSCERPGSLCEHAAAVCAHLARLIDEDPLSLVTLRGGDRNAFVSAVVGTELNTAEQDDDARGAESLIVSPLAARGEPGRMSAASLWRRTLAPLPDAPTVRRRGGQPRIAAQAPPAELGVSTDGLVVLAADALLRASELTTAIETGDTRAVAVLGESLQDRTVDTIRWCVRGVLTREAAADALGFDTERVADIVDHWSTLGVDAIEVFGAPRRLDDDETAMVDAAVAGRVRARSTGVLLDDGSQVRRTSTGLWAVLCSTAPGRWSAVSVGDDLDEVLDAADIESSDPDR